MAVQALLKSLGGPELCNDDRDSVIAKLNQLQAVNGIGQGYFKEGQAPINYNEKNDFYALKGVVYNRICENADRDGIIVLVLNVAFTQLNSAENKQKLVQVLLAILGQPAALTVHVERIKQLDEQRTEVVVYAFESGRGRVSATTLFRYLASPDKYRLLEQQLACQKVVPLVELSAADKEKFLSSPPDGFNPALWRQYVRANPDAARFLPHPVYGYVQLLERQQQQRNSDEVQHRVLVENVDRLKRIQNEFVDLRTHLQSSKRVQKELSHRLLKILAHLCMRMRQSYALNKAEDTALAQAERASADLLGPHALKDRINELLNIVETDRNRIIDYFNNIDVKFTPEEERHLRVQLQVAQSRLEKVSEMLAEDRHTIAVAEKRPLKLKR